MLSIVLNESGKPLYIQIYEYFKHEIEKGNLKPCEKLPSKRKLATALSISVNTVDTAYSQLTAEGYIEAIPQKGFFVCNIEEFLEVHDSLHKSVSVKPTLENNIQIDFSPRDIDSSCYPFNTFRKIFKSIYSEYDFSLIQKPSPQGEPNLRRALTEYLYRSRGVKCTEEQVIIGSGTENLLQILALLFGMDKIIALENPVYLKAYQIFKSMGYSPLPVDIDEKGIKTDPLMGFSNLALYITPSHHFPLGVSMPIDRRIKLLNFANQSENTYIIEDDYDSEFRYNQKPLPSLQSIDKNGKVIYLGTFSKSISPGVRISYMVLPETLLKIYMKQSSYMSSTVSVLEQKMLAEFIRSGSLEIHINRMRKLYKEKRAFLLEELKQLGDSIKVIGENAGHHVLIKLKTGRDEGWMCKKALQLGVKVYPISPYFINGILPKYESKVLLGYGALSREEISKGVNLLKEGWEIQV